ncbi:hypothetical protein C8J57DRAFT_1558720 [Mycena rebaudengoi]|nr:hypothetical protein C8J57DRAFT_1558720 [Mycena rebaudengoi]
MCDLAASQFALSVILNSKHDVAARATNGVKIPARKNSGAEIIKLVQDQMYKLRTWFHSDRQIHIMCDAWQASNTDGYFVVTGHWIEEMSTGVWKLQEAILGFTHLNNAHHGERLAGTLFKIANRQILRATGAKWDPIERRINCLAHIINLATQTLISVYSKSPHFKCHDPAAYIPDTPDLIREEIGLFRPIAVKGQSEAAIKSCDMLFVGMAACEADFLSPYPIVALVLHQYPTDSDMWGLIINLVVLPITPQPTIRESLLPFTSWILHEFHN